MKYGITKPIYTSEAFIELTESEFDAVKTAKANLITVVGIEEKFDLLIENYAEYERELLNLSFDQLLFRHFSYQGFRGNNQAVTRRLANLLSAARLYVDQVKHDLASVYGSESTMAQAITQKLSEEYDRRLGYRVMEATRNYMQHRSLPIHRIAYPCSRDESQGRVRVRFSVIPNIAVAELREDTKFKRSVFEELKKEGPYVPITPLLREYVEGQGAVHESLRAMTTTDVEKWETLLAETQKRGNEQVSGEKGAVSIVALRAEDEVTESHDVFDEIVDYRKVLARKNALLERLAARYVSNAVEGDT